MKITDLKTTPLSIPFKEPEYVSTGLRRGVTQLLVEIETDEGITGLGECICRPNDEVIQAAVLSSKPYLVGKDPLNIGAIVSNFKTIGNWNFFERVGNVVLGGVETALWDILGKYSGLPLYSLLGGLLRERIPIFYYLPRVGLDEMTRRARKAVEEGYETIFFKVGPDFHGDVEAVEAVRDAVGKKVNVRIDANEAWTPGTAIRVIKQIEKYDVEWVEEPLMSKDLNAWARVRHAVRTPIAANQASWGLFDVKDVLHQGAADVLVIDQWQVGGLSAYKKSAALAEAYGIGMSHHSWGETSVGHFAAFHVVASSPNFLSANQSYLGMRQEDIIKGGLPEIENGCVKMPQGPGIGVELDPDRVNQAAERYQKEGAYLAREAHDEMKVAFIPMV